MKFSSLKKFLLDIFFPQFCLGCHREGEIICADCLSLIDILEFQYCPFCSPPKRVIGKGKCDLHQNRKLNGLFAATSYQDSLVKTLIKNFKYPPYLKDLSRVLAFLIIAHFLLTKNQLIFKNKESSLFVPIPLFGFKKKERGFNQAEEIALYLANFFKIPLSNNLIKIKKTQPQVGLTRKEREKNIQGAFAIKEPKVFEKKTIFLVDDVFTSGATMEAGAKVLKKAGASQVWGIVVAREPFF